MKVGHFFEKKNGQKRMARPTANSGAIVEFWVEFLIGSRVGSDCEGWGWG